MNVKSKKFWLRTTSFASLISVAGFLCLGHVLAWFDSRNDVDFDKVAQGTTQASFFAYGDGSAEKSGSKGPYGISTPRHFYNLAWLQYLGEFNKDSDNDGVIDKQYYFELAKDLDMTGYVLPPVGTDTFPFIGNFNGNDHVIKNLTVSNQYSDYSRHPIKVKSSNYKASEVIGTFGVIGTLNTDSTIVSASNDLSGEPTGTATYTSYTESDGSVNPINEVHNLYLEKITIQSKTSQVLSGIVAGYANGTVQNVGVHYANLNYTSGTSRITSSSSSSSLKANGFDHISKNSLIGDYNDRFTWADEPGDLGYGQSFDINILAGKMKTVLGNTNSIEANQYLPFMGTGKAAISDSTIVGEEATDTNIGYFTGSDIKTYSKVYKYYPNYLQITDAAGYVTSTTVDEEDNVYKQTFGSIENGSTAVPLLRLQAKLDINNNLVTINNAKVGGKEYSKITLPRRCVWVKPVKAGKLRFVLVNPRDGYNFTLSKFKRTVLNDLTSSMTGLVTVYESNAHGGGLAPTTGTNKVQYIDNTSADLSSYDATVYYYEFDISQDDIDNGYEFTLSRDNGDKGAYFWYLDLGQNGGNSGLQEGGINAVDFTYVDDTSTNGLALVNDKNYTNSKVAFTIDNFTSTAVASSYYFRRDNDTNLTVLYYVAPSSNLTFTPSTSGTKHTATDETCTTQS